MSVFCRFVIYVLTNYFRDCFSPFIILLFGCMYSIMTREDSSAKENGLVRTTCMHDFVQHCWVTATRNGSHYAIGLSWLSVTLVYCGRMVGWIEMPLGIQIGVGPGHVVLYGDPDLPRQKGPQQPPPTFVLYGCRQAWLRKPRPMSFVAKRLDRSRCYLVER